MLHHDWIAVLLVESSIVEDASSFVVEDTSLDVVVDIVEDIVDILMVVLEPLEEVGRLLVEDEELLHFELEEEELELLDLDY